MSWIALIVAGLFEIIWAVTLKSTEGFTKLFPSLITASSMFFSIWLLSYALKEIPIGTAYAVWTGIGAAGALLFGMIFLGESKDFFRIICVTGIIFCVVCLKISMKISQK